MRTDFKGHEWQQVTDCEWARSSANRTASIQESGFGHFLAVTTGQHSSALEAVAQGAPALVAEEFATFDAAAGFAATLVR